MLQPVAFTCFVARGNLTSLPRTCSHASARSTACDPRGSQKESNPPVDRLGRPAARRGLAPPVFVRPLRRTRPLTLADTHLLISFRLVVSTPFVTHNSPFAVAHLLTRFHSFVGDDSPNWNCPHELRTLHFRGGETPISPVLHARTYRDRWDIDRGRTFHSHTWYLRFLALLAPCAASAHRTIISLLQHPSSHTTTAAAAHLLTCICLYLRQHLSSRAFNLHSDNLRFNEDVSSTGSGPELHSSNVLPRGHQGATLCFLEDFFAPSNHHP